MVLTIPELDSSILDYLRRDGTLREGHFAYRSGRHSGALLDFDRLLADPQAASRMGYALARSHFTYKIDTVAAPSIWGAGLAQWVAYFLEPRARVIYATPERDGSPRIVPNLLELVQGKRVLLVDNVIRSGDTMRAFALEVEALGGEVLGRACLWNSGDHPPGCDVFGLLNDHYPTWDAGSCPLCREGHEELQAAPH